MLRLALLGALSAASPAAAETKTYSVGSFDKIRVDGPFAVTLTTGASPSARADANGRMLETLSVEVQGTTLIVRAGPGGWGERPAARAVAPVITLGTPALRAAFVNAGGQLTIDGLKAQRVDLSVNGSGKIIATGIAADELSAVLVGSGALDLDGKAQRARLLSSGTGTVDASGLAVRDLTVRQDGSGETKALAQATAVVSASGLGAITIAGDAACTVKAPGGGPIICGKE